jgi:hypothetical protein
VRQARTMFHPFFIWDGPWDLAVAPFTNHQVFADLKEASEAGANLHNTEAFIRRVRAMEQGLPFGGIELGEEHKREPLDSIAKIERYFEVRMGLIESIRRDGYLSQAQLGTGHGEIEVVVNRSGQLVKWSNGRNRLAAAILADTLRSMSR